MTNRGKAIGVYIPPAKLRAMREAEQTQKQQKANEEQTDHPLGKNTEEQEDGQVLGNAEITKQRESWNTLKKTINGSINRLNLSNIRDITVKLFGEANLVRGRGLLARSLLKAVLASPAFAHVYAALIAVISAKLPENGELVLCRAIYAFKRSFQRRDKGAALALVKFIAHLVNQSVAHELLALQILTVLLEDPTEDGVEIATALTLELGQFLEEVSPKGMHAVMERFRSILHQGDIDSRVQYSIENLFAIRKGGFEQYPAIVPDLDLVEREDQITFETGLDDDIEKQELLDIFRLDDKFEEGEILWGKIRSEILGDDESSGDDDDDDDESEEEEDDNDTKEVTSTALTSKNTTIVHDLTEEDLIHLRRTIYLTIMSAATFEECAHKLARINIPIGKEHELVNMLIECCSQERTFLRYYGLISQRFCLMHFRWRNAFTQAFHEQYMTVHRLETNKLRNVAKLFAHLLHTDALSWSEALTTIHLNEDETTSSSRIFIKILVQEMAEAMGIARLKERLMDQEMQEEIKGLFPKDASKPRDTRYAINFFTSIGLGPLTDDLREFLKNAPKLIMAQAQAASNRGNDDNSTVSSSSSSSSSSSTTSSSTSGSSRSSSSSGSSQSYSSSSFTSRSSSSSRSRRRSRSRGRRRRRSRSSSSSSSSSSRSSSTSSRSSHSSGRRKVRSEAPSSHRRSRSRRNRHRSASPTIGKDDRNRSRRSRSVSKSPTEEMPKDGHNNSSRSKLRERRTRRRRNSGTESLSGQSRNSSRSISRSPTTSTVHRTKRGGISRSDSHSRSLSRERGSGKYKRSRSPRGRGEYTSRRSRSRSVSPDTERNKRHRVGQMRDASRDIVQSDRSSYMGRGKPNPDVDDFGRAIRRPTAHD